MIHAFPLKYTMETIELQDIREIAVELDKMTKYHARYNERPKVRLLRHIIRDLVHWYQWLGR